MDRDCNWRGIADKHFLGGPFQRRVSRFIGDHTIPGLFSDAFPKSLSCRSIKRHHTGIGLATDEHYQLAPFQDRCASRPEEVARHFPVLGSISLPDQLASFQVQAYQTSLSPKRVAASFGQQGRAARPIVVSIGVREIGVVLVLPDFRPVIGTNALDDVEFPQAMMNHQLLSASGRRTVTGPDPLVPKYFGTCFVPGINQTGLIRNAGSLGAQKNRPVASRNGLVWNLGRVT